MAKELDTLLRWHGYKANEIKTKPQNLACWQTIQLDGRAMRPPESVRLLLWTKNDEANLSRLQNMEIEIGDTMLGRMNELKKRELKAAVNTMTQSELDELKLEIADVENTDQDLRGTAI